MYIDFIELQDFRSFKKATIEFAHPGQNYNALGMPSPRLKNINLLLGNNGHGKTTLLKAIALCCLGPAVGRSGIFPYRLIRREPAGKVGAIKSQPVGAELRASFTTHPQDRSTPPTGKLDAVTAVWREGDLENLEWRGADSDHWKSIFSADSDAFFFVGYGATRRAEQKEQYDPGGRRSRTFARAQRVQSLFEDTYSLVPLSSWLPAFEAQNMSKFEQVVSLLNKLIGAGHYQFTGEMEQGEYLYERGGLKVPFPALSDGYRAYLGWVGDLLYHICMTCPSAKRLDENVGVVMVDEIDLHLHPKWQMTVLPTLAKALPNIQFIVTSHSPLVVGSLEWMNIITMQPGPRQSSKLKRVEDAVHGLDADQVLLTDFFGLQSTRSSIALREMKDLTLKAREGDTQAAQMLLAQLSRGMERSE